MVTYKILHSLRKKKCQLKGRFQLNLQAFDKYVHPIALGRFNDY